MIDIETVILELVFTDGYNNVKVALANPKEDLTGTQVEEAMDDMLTAGIFVTKNGPFVAKVSAQIVRRTVSEFEL